MNAPDNSDRSDPTGPASSDSRPRGRPRYTPAVWLATGLGAGFSPIAPGTCGALWGLPLAWGIQRIGDWQWQLVAIAAICLVGIPICQAAARDLGGKKDPSAIVLDEIASMPITFFLVPMDSAWVVAAGFVLNRLFDVTKPPPIGRIERLPGGLGIMADDWMAGVYSCVALHAFVWAASWLG